MIYTSYYSNIRNMPEDMIFVSIAGYAPEWFIKSQHKNWCQYKILAPKYIWWKEWHDKFIDNLNSNESITWYRKKYYATVLNVLDINQVILDLSNLSNNKDICLVCYETPDKFCHRQIVQEWLNNNNIQCNEFYNSKYK